jgi:hypothetical protein
LFQSIEKFHKERKMRFAKNISRAQAPSDPLPPWNDGAAKKVITDFLGRVTRGKACGGIALGRPRFFPGRTGDGRTPQSALEQLTG